MRCVSYCIAKELQANAIAAVLKPQANYQTKFYRNVLHIAVLDGAGDIFCFPQGCIVFWGLHRRQEQELIELLRTFSNFPLEKFEMDSFSFHMGAETQIYTHQRFNVAVIELGAANVPAKLAISYGLAQSIKLAAYEDAIEKTVNANKSISEQLSVQGKISLSRRAILRRMGEIFVERSYVNLSSEYLEVPEYFWQYANLETYYVLVEKYLDVPRRVAALNRKLDVLHEIFDMLNNQLQHRHSSMLEMIIIGLIVFEIILSLTRTSLGI